MACAKSGSTDRLRPQFGDDESGQRSILYLIMIGNTHGIKQWKKVWIRDADLQEYTYFLLPANFEVSCFIGKYVYDGSPDIKPIEFTQFWLSLDDLHKERRFLVTYLCALRAIDAMFDGNADSEINVLREMLTGHLLKVRRLLITEQKKNGGEKLKIIIARFFELFLLKQMCVGTSDSRFANDVFGDLNTAMKRMQNIVPGGMAIATKVSREFFVGLFNSLAAVYVHWAMIDPTKVEEYVGGKERHLFQPFIPFMSNVPSDHDFQDSQRWYLQKLRVAVPHWRVKDRAYILKTMRAKKKSGKPCYVDRLLSCVGPDQFKLIAFGKEKFCSNCGRSSYVLEDRLWSCGLCDKENVRPQARYCDVACQKAHWLKHKSEVHAQPSCFSCGKKTAALRACKRCREENVRHVALYCNVQCQQDDWPKHKRQAHSGEKI